MPIKVTLRPEQRLRRRVTSTHGIELPANTVTKVPVAIKRGKKPLPPRDFLFKPSKAYSAYAAITTNDPSHILVANCEPHSVKLPWRTHLGWLTEADQEGEASCFTNWHHLAADQAPYLQAIEGDGSLSKNVWYDADAEVFVQTAPIDASSQIEITDSDTRDSPPVITVDSADHCGPFGTSIHARPPPSRAMYDLSRAIEAYPKLFTDEGRTANVPEDQWMRIPLVSDWQVAGAKLSHKVYPLGPKEKALVDEQFDKLHQQGKMSWNKDQTPFAFPVFVVWKTVLIGPDKIPHCKGRVVVDIRGLNRISTPNSYPMPLQEDITAAVKDCHYITVTDGLAFFYQWPITREDCHKLTVTSHRGNEQFNVALMGYRNSPPYVQRCSDEILRKHRQYARVYMDDFIIFSKSLEDHMKHLYAVFKDLQALNLTLTPAKTFVGYPSINLLGQKVDAFGLTTSEEKLAAIRNISFPKTVSDLERYLGLTGWLRNYIPGYSQIGEPLQKEKAARLRKAPRQGHTRKNFTKTSEIEPTEELLDAFHQLQKRFAGPTTLAHFDPKWQLYIDVDAAKQRGFGVMVYHAKTDPPIK